MIVGSCKCVVQEVKLILFARWRLAPGDEPGLLPGAGVPGTSVSSSGLRGPRGVPWSLALVVDAVFVWLPQGRWGGGICQSCALDLSASLVGPCAMDPL